MLRSLRMAIALYQDHRDLEQSKARPAARPPPADLRPLPASTGSLLPAALIRGDAAMDPILRILTYAVGLLVLLVLLLGLVGTSIWLLRWIGRICCAGADHRRQ